MRHDYEQRSRGLAGRIEDSVRSGIDETSADPKRVLSTTVPAVAALLVYRQKRSKLALLMALVPAALNLAMLLKSRRTSREVVSGSPDGALPSPLLAE